jgi:hypothetical protein
MRLSTVDAPFNREISPGPAPAATSLVTVGHPSAPRN